ncbi:hypothetical protein GUJ93_ZPchr0008g12344 [Zizania palustris]|uniref:Carbonic anhydrase n=1 Tax=Zizania palustris TaxID=103762 RepID=A0A8J5RC65_ZIZPA|nr:hypothetical protein GUJ93_ZPchr0008g12344 [Zizania palustris]
MHWHTPSEHTIDDRRYDMELHMVHLNAQNEAAVIGILYDVGFRRDKFLYKLEPYIRKIANQKDKEVLVHGGVDPNIAKGPLDNIYYRFMGSFTTPPCTEGVTWTIIKEVRTVSFDQLALLRAAVLDGFENNARPVQDVNNREIQLFFPLPLSIERGVPIRDAFA